MITVLIHRTFDYCLKVNGTYLCKVIIIGIHEKQRLETACTFLYSGHTRPRMYRM